MDLAGMTGEGFGPHRLRVCISNVSDFIRVTGDDPDRWAKAAPPGFISAALFAVAPDLLSRLDGRSVIHGEQTFTWAHPLALEEEVEVTGAVSKVRERSGTSFVGFDMTVSGGPGVIATGSSLFLVGEDTDREDGPMEASEPAPLDDGNPGPGERSMSRADLVAYAAATRDWNPIHWDHQAAVAAGLPGVVVHGLAQAAWALGEVAARRPGDRPIDNARIRFRNPLRPATPVQVLTDESEGVATVSIRDDSLEFLSARIGLAG